MTRPKRRTIAGATALLLTTVFLPAHEARADDDTFVIVGAISLAALLGGADIAFGAYTGGVVGRHEEPSQSWMIAQTTVAGAQGLAFSVAATALGADDRREEGYELLTAPFIILTGGLATFGAWSLGAPGETDVKARLGLSFVASTNLAFTALGIGAHFDERFTPYYASIPQVALMAPEAVLTAIQAARDEGGRPGWIALSAWSGALAIHGTINLIGKALGGDAEATETPPSIPDPSAPALSVPDPYYIDPARPLEAPPPPSPPAIEAPSPAVVPAPIPGGASVGPGFMVIGAF